MKTVTARIPDSLLKDLEGIEREEKAERANIIRRLLDNAVKNWKIKGALHKLNDGRITRRTAAKQAGLTYVEMLDRAKEADISVGYSMEDLQRDLTGLKGKE